jgi:hypothetical protein
MYLAGQKEKLDRQQEPGSEEEILTHCHQILILKAPISR